MDLFHSSNLISEIKLLKTVYCECPLHVSCIFMYIQWKYNVQSGDYHYLVSVQVLVKYSVKQSTEELTFPVATIPFSGCTEMEYEAGELPQARPVRPWVRFSEGHEETTPSFPTDSIPVG